MENPLKTIPQVTFRNSKVYSIANLNTSFICVTNLPSGEGKNNRLRETHHQQRGDQTNDPTTSRRYSRNGDKWERKSIFPIWCFKTCKSTIDISERGGSKR